MAKKHELTLTRGEFQVKGIVTGAEKDNFYMEKKTAKGKDFRMVNFGVEFEKGKSIYISLNGMPKDEVFFSKKVDGKTEVKKIPFAQRSTFNEEGYGLIGINLGLTKNEKGENEKVRLVEFDAVKYIAENLKDGASIFIKGNVEYGSFTDDKGNKKRTVKYIPSQISLCSKDIDFEEDKFESKHAFSQVIVFKKIDKKQDSNDFLVQANIVNYSGIEDAEFTIKDKALANTLRGKMKPYNAIRVHGNIEVTESVVEDNDDCWGAEDTTKVVSAPTIREMVITGATPSTLDTSTYSEAAFNEAIQKINAKEQAKDDWGSKPVQEVDETDEEW